MVLKPSGPWPTVAAIQYVALYKWRQWKANALPLTLIYDISVLSHEVEVQWLSTNVHNGEKSLILHIRSCMNFTATDRFCGYTPKYASSET